MSRIFLSYRRQDQPHAAARIYDNLCDPHSIMVHGHPTCGDSDTENSGARRRFRRVSPPVRTRSSEPATR